MRTNNQNNISLIKDNNLDELLRVNNLYIIKIAKSYKQIDSIQKDLVQEGRIGMLEAAAIFDETINPNFLTIATYYIKKSMIEYIKNNSTTIRLPINFWRTRTKIENKMVQDEFYDIYADDELSDGQRLAHTNAKRVISGDLANDEGNSFVFNSIAYNEGDYEEEYEKEDEARTKLFKLLEKLKPNEQILIKQYYGIDIEKPMTYREMGKIYGVTHQAINDKIKRIEKKLRNT